MKTVLLLSLFLSFGTFSQEDSCAVIIEYPDVEAQFPGGSGAMLKFINTNLEYPECDLGDVSEFSRFYLCFIVCADGRIQPLLPIVGTSAAVEKFSNNLLEKMPNWIPAQDKGKNVASRMRIPITIHFD